MIEMYDDRKQSFRFRHETVNEMEPQTPLLSEMIRNRSDETRLLLLIESNPIRAM